MVTIEGHGMLGSTVGSTSFAKEFAAHKVEEFVQLMSRMSRIFGEKRSKPYNFLAYHSKSPYFSIIV